MSTLNTTNIKHAGNAGDANIVLASNGDVTINGDLSAEGGRFSANTTIGGTVASPNITLNANGNVDSTNTAGAWINFAGTGAIGDQAVRADYNVDRVEKTATGRYTIFFTRQFSSSDICPVVVSNQFMTWVDDVFEDRVQISVGNASGTRVDASQVFVVVYGDY